MKSVNRYLHAGAATLLFLDVVSKLQLCSCAKTTDQESVVSICPKESTFAPWGRLSRCKPTGYDTFSLQTEWIRASSHWCTTHCSTPAFYFCSCRVSEEQSFYCVTWVKMTHGSRNRGECPRSAERALSERTSTRRTRRGANTNCEPQMFQTQGPRSPKTKESSDKEEETHPHQSGQRHREDFL